MFQLRVGIHQMKWAQVAHTHTRKKRETHNDREREREQYIRTDSECFPFRPKQERVCWKGQRAVAWFVQKQQWLALPSWLSEHRPCGLSSSFPVSSKVNTISSAWFPPKSVHTQHIPSASPKSPSIFDLSISLIYPHPHPLLSPLFNTALEFSFHRRGCFQIERKHYSDENVNPFLWWYCQLDGTTSICICAWNLMTWHTPICYHSIYPSIKDSLIMLLSCQFVFFSANPSKWQNKLCVSSQNEMAVPKTMSIWAASVVRQRLWNKTVCWLLVGHRIQNLSTKLSSPGGFAAL